MDGYFRLNMKRKEFEDVNDEFSDFSLSSPARKTRRLDVDLLPVIEEEEPEISMSFEQSEPEQSFAGNTGGLTIEELPSVPENEERSIVIFNPMNTPLRQSPSNFSISVNPDLISGFRNQVLWSGQSNNWEPKNTEAVTEDENSAASNKCLAVVPWVPSQHHSTPGVEVPQMDNSGMMDAEDKGEASMDIEADNDIIDFEQRNANESGGMSFNDGIHQWQQQQPCMIPQPPQNTATPIVWYR